MRRRGDVNRSIKIGAPIYCGTACAGIARRDGKSIKQKRTDKRDYDRLYRKENLAAIKAGKAKHFKETYDPVAAAIHRKTRSAYHVEYCRRSYVKEKKQIYDRKHRAKLNYGEFSECFLLAQDIGEECLTRQTKYEMDLAKGTLNKVNKRKQNYDRLNSNKPEIGPMGNSGKLA